jgi:HD-like signal output (HDOD) protein
MAKLASPKAEIDDLIKIIVFAPLLTYKIMKVVNSPVYRGVNKIESIRVFPKYLLI